MFKVNKKAAGIILGCMVGIFGCMPTMASELSVNPCVLVRSCQECLYGTVSTYTSKIYQHEETFPCAHATGNGIDKYKIYEVIERSSCDSCSYSSVRTWEDHELVSCPCK